MSDATVVDLASASDAELAAEISSPGAPPVMTKDGPKSPTRKMEAAASARKEATLRAVLRAQVDADYRADRLVRPLCLGVLRGRNSTPTQIRLATEDFTRLRRRSRGRGRRLRDHPRGPRDPNRR